MRKWRTKLSPYYQSANSLKLELVQILKLIARKPLFVIIPDRNKISHRFSHKTQQPSQISAQNAWSTWPKISSGPFYLSVPVRKRHVILVTVKELQGKQESGHCDITTVHWLKMSVLSICHWFCYLFIITASYLERFPAPSCSRGKVKCISFLH